MLDTAAIVKYLEQYDALYPGIDLWFKNRVVPDWEKGKKFIITQTVKLDNPYKILAIVDIPQKKLCHFSIDPFLRGSGLGKEFFISIIPSLRYNYNIHSLFCHAPESTVDRWCKFLNAERVKDLGNFGRDSGEYDVQMRIEL